MAFRSGRGNARGSMAGGSRGRGGTGGSLNGRGRGAGRGRGRGGRGRGPIFDSRRLAEQKEREAENAEDDSAEPSEDDDELGSEGLSSDEDEEEDQPTIRPYNALLQSFALSSGPPPNKKRKVDNPPQSLRSSPQYKESVESSDEETSQETGAETEKEVDEYLETDDAEDTNDPFHAHFVDPDHRVLSSRLAALENNEWSTNKIELPKEVFSKSGKCIFAVPGKDQSEKQVVPFTPSSPQQLHLKKKLMNIMIEQRPKFDPLEQFVSSIFTYRDFLLCARSVHNAERLRRLTCLHVLNHVFKTRDRVIKNNERFTKEGNSDDLDLKDQGFTRPKVLILLPERNSCAQMVDMIVSLCDPEQEENRKKFNDAYVDDEEEGMRDKPEDFRELFGGKAGDDFRVGIKFTRKTIKFFSGFYKSDIIIASPLGLRLVLEGEGKKKADYDFLSSIEIVVVDQVNALLMQNWTHLEFVFEHLNKNPKESHDSDYSRIRDWYLEGQARHFRQVIAFSAFNTPELNTLFYSQSSNWAGRIKTQPHYPGALLELGLQVKQTFSRTDSPSFTTDSDARFKHFTTTVLPSLVRRIKDTTGTLIFIPLYEDFLRVRNHFASSNITQSLSFGAVWEYAEPPAVISRARSHFLTGRHSILLYTERAHHFFRYSIRGVRKVIMYGLPENPDFYKDIVSGFLGRSIREGKLEPGEGSVRVLFSKWDAMKLERVAGTERVGRMIKDRGDTFEFV